MPRSTDPFRASANAGVAPLAQRAYEAESVASLHLYRAALDDAAAGACRVHVLEPRVRANGGVRAPEPPGPVLAIQPALVAEPDAEAVLAEVTCEWDGTLFRLGLRVPSGSSFYGTGMVAGPLLRNRRATTLWNTDAWCYGEEAPGLYQSHPWVLVLRADGSALGLLAETARRGRIECAEDGVELAFEGGPFRLWRMEAAHPRAVLAALSVLVGRAELPPRWSLGYHQCRWSYASADEVRALVRGFAERALPLAAVWLDIDHMERFRVLTWDAERFSQPAELVRELQAAGVRVVAIVDPGVARARGYALYEELLAGGHAVLLADGSPARGRVWPGTCHFPDFTRAETRAWWSEHVRAHVERVPLDGLWCDMNEPAVMRAPERTLPLDARHAGDGETLPPGDHARWHNLYGHLMAQATHAGLQAARPERRPFVLSRAAHAGTARFAAAWTGDNQARWEDLAWSLSMTLNLGLSGQPFAGPDVGGFCGDPSPELFARWYAACSLLPFFRGHSEKSACRKEPWSFGPAILAHVRTALVRRARLLPTLYTLFEEAERCGLPPVRPVWWADPADPELRAIDDAYLVGEDLLVAPVLRAGERKREVLLPVNAQGGWYRLDELGNAAITGLSVTLPAPLGALPLFGRAGAILVEEDVDGTLVLVVCPDASGRARGRLFEDAGDGFGRRQGAFLERTFEARVEKDRVVVRSTPRGAWRVPARALRVVVHGAQGGKQPGQAPRDREDLQLDLALDT